MIAELLYSLIAYLLFVPNVVALREPPSHQTHFLASAKWLVSLHLTPHRPMSLLVRVWRRKKVAGALVVFAHLQLSQNFKTYRTLYFLLMCSVIRCQPSELLWTREKEGKQVCLFIMIRFSPFLSCCHGIFFPLVLSTCTRKVGYGSAHPFFFSLHFLYPTFAHTLFLLWMVGMTGGWYLGGITSKWDLPLCVFVSLCFRAFWAERGRFGRKVFKSGLEDLGRWGGWRVKGRISLDSFGNSRKIQLNCIVCILTGFDVVNVVCCSLALH